MLDRDFLADGALPLPNGYSNTPQIVTGPTASPTLAAIRDKAERIVDLLARGPDDPAALSLAEDLAQDIVELCPVCGGGPGCIH